jgi:hypothetical protein
MYERLRIRETNGVPRRESAVRRRLRFGSDRARLASLTATRLTLTDEVAADFRAVVVEGNGGEHVLDARVELPDGARAMLLAVDWRDGRSVLDAVREIGFGCLRRAGADRLLGLARSGRVSVQASVEDIRLVLARTEHGPYSSAQ